MIHNRFRGCNYSSLRQFFSSQPPKKLFLLSCDKISNERQLQNHKLTFKFRVYESNAKTDQQSLYLLDEVILKGYEAFN